MTRTFRRIVLLICLAVAWSIPAHARAQSDPRTAGLYRDSYALEIKGDYAGAVAKMREVRQLSSNGYFAVVRLAWLQYLAGDYTASAAAYADAIGLEPKAIEPKIGLTLPLAAAKKWRELDRACRDVLAVDPQNAIVRARLAQALYWAGNYADSAAAYERLAGDYPSNLDYKTGLGWALLKQGRVADAKQVMQQVLAVSPDNPSAKEGLAVK